jgi:ABC-type antimicrobial peptide transport system permease subunit
MYTATERTPGLELYYPYTQYAVSTSRIAVRFRGDVPATSEAVRRAMREAAPEIAVSDLKSMDRLMLDTLWQQRLWGFLLVAFAALALLLSAVGLYGVIGYLVKQRQFEFGIRLALGATRGHILASVTREGFLLVVVGLVIGTGVSLLLARSISGLLVAVTANDPVVFAVVLLLVAIVGLGSALVPAYRAMSVEPSSALRGR